MPSTKTSRHSRRIVFMQMVEAEMGLAAYVYMWYIQCRHRYPTQLSKQRWPVMCVSPIWGPHRSTSFGSHLIMTSKVRGQTDNQVQEQTFLAMKVRLRMVVIFTMLIDHTKCGRSLRGNLSHLHVVWLPTEQFSIMLASFFLYNANQDWNTIRLTLNGNACLTVT